MSRYYDLDKLKEMIEVKADTLIEGKEAFLYVAKWLDLLPPADVVPKNEVMSILNEIENTIRGALVLIGFSYKHNDKEIQCKKECYEDFLGYIAELKKKYTEGNDGKAN